MKKLILGSLSILLIAATSAVRAEAVPYNTTNSNNASTATRAYNPTISKQMTASKHSYRLKPFNLVYLAYQGYFKNRGIPSYSGLISAYKLGRIQPVDLVQAAIQADKLAPETIKDRHYLAGVNNELKALSLE